MKLIIAIIVLVHALGGATSAAGLEIIDPEQVAAGTTGVCVTEMEGGELVRIPITVIGTVGPAAPEGEIVLVRLEDSRFSKTGIIAGMSGSPVYIGDRLLGALAFGWSFSREPIGGVTPFRRMVRLADEPGGGNPAGLSSGRPSLLDLRSGMANDRLGEMLVEWLIPERRDGLSPLPLAFSTAGSFGSTSHGWIATAFQRLGWQNSPIGGGSSAQVDAAPLEPGSMVAAVLVSGDASLSAGGTVTAVDGDRVWAFGHPFLGLGRHPFPMARADVLTVLPSLASSFKVFNVGDIVGRFDIDRTHGLLGQIGSNVTMVPIDITIDGRHYEFESIRHPALLPLLSGFLTQSSYSARGRVFGDQTLSLKVEARYESAGVVRYEDSMTGGDAGPAASALVSMLLGYLENSPLSPPKLESVSIELMSEEKVRLLELMDVAPSHWQLAPGEALWVRARFRSRTGAHETHRIKIQVPDEASEGKLDLVIAGGGSWNDYDLRMRPLIPASFAGEIELIHRLLPSSDLVVALEAANTGVAYLGGHVAVPVGVMADLKSGLGSDLVATTHRVLQLEKLDLGSPVLGAKRLSLRVVRSDTGRKRGVN
ncbi:MAG: hypothetical protein GY906_21845 [bacterium]|nr:hypothetical protein [bacterium]